MQMEMLDGPFRSPSTRHLIGVACCPLDLELEDMSDTRLEALNDETAPNCTSVSADIKLYSNGHALYPYH